MPLPDNMKRIHEYLWSLLVVFATTGSFGERVSAFLPLRARVEQHVGSDVDETSPPSTFMQRHAAKGDSNQQDFWDEHFRGEENITPSDRMKEKAAAQSSESIDEQLKELDVIAAKRPTIPGDYDWDEAYKDDPNWVTGDKVPGKMKFTAEQIQEQEDALEALAAKWSS